MLFARLPRGLLPSLLCGALAGCAVTADYHPTPVDMPTRWSEAPTGNASIIQSAVAWWTMFHDSELTSLIERAVQSNLDVQLAQTRLREVRTQLRITSASFSPSLNATASYAREKESTNAPAPVMRNRDGALESASGQSENLFQAGFDAVWELDIFGGQRRSIEEARATAEAAAFERDAVILTLLAEVSRAYIELRTTQRQIVLATTGLTTQKELVKLVRARYAGGMATYADVEHAELLVRRSASEIPPMESSYKNAVNRLSVLLGQRPDALTAELQKSAMIPVAVPDFSTGLPSDLLRQRPDILREERKIAVASARLGVATADLYPRFSLTGAAGLASVSARDFLSSASLLWKIGPTMTWPIFRRGQAVATVEIRDVQLQEALLVYRKTILYALEEVDNAIATYTQQRNRHDSLAGAVIEVEQSVKLSRSRYTGGMSDLREVLDAEVSLLQAQADLARSDAAIAISLVALYKSLGGGWNVATLVARSDSVDQPVSCRIGAVEGKQKCSTSP